MSAAADRVRAVVSHDLCCGSGICTYEAPSAYRYDPSRLAVFEPTGDCTDEAVRQGAEACPMGAITVLGDAPPTAGHD